jgi:hypothetical protein
MTDAKYIIEIYEPGSTTDVLVSFTSPSPFMPIEYGSLIDPKAWGNSDRPGKVLRVLNVEHGIWETDAITHRLRVFTEEVQDTSEMRYKEENNIASTFSKIRNGARRLSKEVYPSELKKKGVRVLEDQIPWIQALSKEKLGPLAKETIQNDEAMTRAFRTAYEFLPTPIRLTVEADSFVAFCLRNRDRLIETRKSDEPSEQPPAGEHGQKKD